MRSQAASPSMTTIGHYLIERLLDHDVDHVFGVPGDFVLGFMQHLEASPLELINTCDEQGAGFAADAYARLRGLGVVCVTYGVGGLKIANTTGQAYAEKSPVVIISGAPSMSERRRHPLIHHKVRSYDTQFRVFQQITAASTVLDDPEIACREIDRVLSIARRQSRPVYIELPRDMVDVKVVPPIVQAAVVDESDPQRLEAALQEATSWIASARQPVIVFGVELHRFGLEDVAMAFVDSSGIPVTETLLDKAAIDESHPSFIGVYAGAMGREDVCRYVEESDCLILLGTLLTDVNLGIFTAELDLARCIHATSERLSLGLHSYDRVKLTDFVHGLTSANIPRRENAGHPRASESDVLRPREWAPHHSVTVESLFSTLAGYIDEETIVVADPGDAMFASIDLPIKRFRGFLAPAFYASLGFAVPAALGVQSAQPNVRPLVLVGDGAFQMTGMELSTCALFGLDPIVVVLNNNGYTTERLILDGKFNDIQPWDYSKIPDVIRSGRSRTVRTNGDLAEALEASKHRDGEIFLLDVHLDKMDVSPALTRLGEALNKEATASA